jgi:hypothetical protein
MMSISIVGKMMNADFGWEQLIVMDCLYITTQAKAEFT